MIRNLKSLNIIIRKKPCTFKLDFDSTASENFGITLKMQNQIKKLLKKERETFKLYKREWITTKEAR